MESSKRKELKSLIERLKKLSSEFQDMANVTNTNKEENLLDSTVTSIDDLIYFYGDLEDVDEINIEPLDQGHEYVMGIRENVAHRM